MIHLQLKLAQEAASNGLNISVYYKYFFKQEQETSLESFVKQRVNHNRLGHLLTRD